MYACVYIYICTNIYIKKKLQFIYRNAYFELKRNISINTFLDALHQSDSKNVWELKSNVIQIVAKMLLIFFVTFVCTVSCILSKIIG